MTKSILPAGIELVGKITGEGDLVVRGNINGEVEIDGDLRIENGATIRGDVRARAFNLFGTVLGDVSATESIRVEETGCMVGDIRAPRVQVIKGARFRGQVRQAGEPAESITPASVDSVVTRQPAQGDSSSRRPPPPKMPSLGRTHGQRKAP